MSSWCIEESKTLRNRRQARGISPYPKHSGNVGPSPQRRQLPSGKNSQNFPGRPQTLHWSIPDPAKATGTDTEINAAFNQAFFLLKERIEALRT